MSFKLKSFWLPKGHHRFIPERDKKTTVLVQGVQYFNTAKQNKHLFYPHLLANKDLTANTSSYAYWYNKFPKNWINTVTDSRQRLKNCMGKTDV